MDSPIKWVGGKSKSAKKIVGMLPNHDCYCEVFFGGGWVFFAKEVSKVEIINDINSELVNLYRVLQTDEKGFLERAKYELYSREMYNGYRDDMYKGAKVESLERAFRFFCLLQEAYAGRTGHWGFSSSRNEARVFFNSIDDLAGITKRLRGVQVERGDFERVIKAYDSEKTLFFCDPPYCTSDNVDYEFEGSKFGLYDHQRLYLILKNIKGKFILTIDDCEFVRERYGLEYKIINNEVYYSSCDKNNRKHVNELIICNFDVNKEKKHIDINQGKLDF